MAWPTNKPDSNKFSADTNSIKESRPEIKTMSDAVNDIVDFVDTAALANGYILEYNSSTGKLEFVPNTNAIEINGGEGITVDQESTGGFNIEFSGTYDAGNITYTLASSQLELLGSGSITPTIKSTSSGGEKGITLATGGSPVSSIYLEGGSTGNINIIPSGTGVIYVDGKMFLGPLNTDTELNTRGTGNLTIQTNGGTNSGIIKINQGTNGKMEITPNGTGITDIKNIVYQEPVHTLPYGVNITPDVSTNGSLQEITLTGNVAFQGFASAENGHSLTLIIKQDGTGNRTFTEDLDSAGRMLFAGGTQTLSTAANAIDIMTIVYAGGIYYASLSTNFS
jgi:hypothetical protein